MSTSTAPFSIESQPNGHSSIRAAWSAGGGGGVSSDMYVPPRQTRRGERMRDRERHQQQQFNSNSGAGEKEEAKYREVDPANEKKGTKQQQQPVSPPIRLSPITPQQNSNQQHQQQQKPHATITTLPIRPSTTPLMSTSSQHHHSSTTTTHDPFANVPVSALHRRALSELESDDEEENGEGNGDGSGNGSTKDCIATSSTLPPHLLHLDFPSQSFPLSLVLLASRIFHAKVSDLGLKESKINRLEKERRFVWLVCRQSCGGGGGGTNSDGSSSTSTTSSSSSSLLSFRIPDASLGLNSLREICSFLSTDTRFSTLQLSGNIIPSPEGVEMLTQMLAQNTNLTTLDLRATGLGQAGFDSLFTSLLHNHNTSLTYLDVSSLKSEGRMFLGVKGMKALSKLLQQNTSLRRLHLSNSGLVAEGITSLTKGLAYNRTLTHLDLSANNLSTKSISKLSSQALCYLSTSLQILNLSNNSFGTYGAILLCETSLRKMEHLKKLDLRACGIGLRGFTVLTDAIGDMISIQEMLLDGNGMAEGRVAIGSSGGGGGGGAASSGGSGGGSGVSITSAQHYNTTDELRMREYVETLLKRLHLTERKVSQKIACNTSLRILSLNQTGINDKLVEELCKLLGTHKNLHTLCLSSNNLTDASAMNLASFIRENKNMTSLYLNENAIGDEGGRVLGEALWQPASASSTVESKVSSGGKERNGNNINSSDSSSSSTISTSSSLTFLGLRVNNVGRHCASACISAMSHRHTLHVDLSGNKIPWILYSKLNELSTRNRRSFAASLSERYQTEYNQLQEQYEHRLHIDVKVQDSIAEAQDLQETYDELDAGRDEFKHQEEQETKKLLLELQAVEQEAHEFHARENQSESALQAFSKEQDGKVIAARKAIEKEQRFIAATKEKTIPVLLEDIIQEKSETEAAIMQVRRELRLIITDRNVELDGCTVMKNELVEFLKILDVKQTEMNAASAAATSADSNHKKGKKSSPAMSPKAGSRPKSSNSMNIPSNGAIKSQLAGTAAAAGKKQPLRPESREIASKNKRLGSTKTSSAAASEPEVPAAPKSRPSSGRVQLAAGVSSIETVAAVNGSSTNSSQVNSTREVKRATTAPIKKTRS